MNNRNINNSCDKWRWFVLVLLILAMLGGYVFNNALSPLQNMLQDEKGWSPMAYGRYGSAEAFLNVFFLFLIFSGFIVDKLGVRKASLISTSLMVIGGAINYYALTDSFLSSSLSTRMDNFMNLPDTWWNITPFYEGMPSSAKMSSLGYMIFGVGIEMAAVSASRATIKWFRYKELSLSMGIQVAVTRLSVAAIMLASPWLASMYGHINVSRPLALGLLLLVISLIAVITYYFIDRKYDNQVNTNSENEFVFKDLKLIFTSGGFWIVGLMCISYYSAVIPFMRYGTSMLQSCLSYSSKEASTIFFILPLGSALFAPLLCAFVDRYGYTTKLLFIGGILLIISFLIFGLLLPVIPEIWLALTAIIVLGLASAIITASLWPTLPKLMDEKVLGSTYAIIYWLQNIGIWAFNTLLAVVLVAYNKDVSNPMDYNYMSPMILCAILGFITSILAIVLRVYDRRNSIGLDKPNIVRNK
jgi:MFS family permease